jgi:hypothetical protein
LIAANAEPRRPLATISDEAMAMATRAAVVLLLNIDIHDDAIFLRNTKLTQVHNIFKILMANATAK